MKEVISCLHTQNIVNEENEIVAKRIEEEKEEMCLEDHANDKLFSVENSEIAMKDNKSDQEKLEAHSNKSSAARVEGNAYDNTGLLKDGQFPPASYGLYENTYERDSCGVGIIADIQGRSSRRIVSDAWKLLVRMSHRGGHNEEDGDGAGIMVGMPDSYYRKLSNSGLFNFTLPPNGCYGVGMFFLPGDEERRYWIMERVEEEVCMHGFSILGWRSPLPTKSLILGPHAKMSEPFIAQIFVCKNEVYEEILAQNSFSNQSLSNCSSIYSKNRNVYPNLPSDLETLLFLIRRKLVKHNDMYICSFSSRTVVYKGLLQADRLFNYFDDLLDEDFTSYFAMVHSRFSTNTFPTWSRAHPFRRISHNGEINTIEGNRKWLIARSHKLKSPSHLNNFDLESILPVEEPSPIVTVISNDDSSVGNNMNNNCILESGSSSSVLANQENGGGNTANFVGGGESVQTNIPSAPPDFYYTNTIVGLDEGEANTVSSNKTTPNIYDELNGPSGLEGSAALYETSSLKSRLFINSGMFSGSGSANSGDEVQSPFKIGGGGCVEGGAQQRVLFEAQKEPPKTKGNKDSPSDSATVDNMIEFLCMCGNKSIVSVIMCLFPEAFHKYPNMCKKKKSFYKYNSCIVEPWDGPALITFSDGYKLGAVLDRNGLRPARYLVTTDDRFVLASEVGVVDIPNSLIKCKGRLMPGKIVVIDFNEKRLINDEEIKMKHAEEYPYEDWLSQNALNLDELYIPLDEDDTRKELNLESKDIENTSKERNNKLATRYNNCKAGDLKNIEIFSTSAARNKYTKALENKSKISTKIQSKSKFSKGSAFYKSSASIISSDVDVFNESLTTPSCVSSCQVFHNLESSNNSNYGLHNCAVTVEELIRKMKAFGFTQEKLDMIISPMCKRAADSLGSMGNDSGLACLSDLPRNPSDYFQQLFAQATNPAIDPIREDNVMSLECPIGPDEFDLLAEPSPSHCKKIFVQEPVLDPGHFRALLNLPNFPAYILDMTWNVNLGANYLEQRLTELESEAVYAVKKGYKVLVLSDRKVCAERVPVFSVLAGGAINQKLVNEKLRTDCCILVECGDAFEVHQFCLLLSCGIDCIYPYMTYQSLSRVRFKVDESILTLCQMIDNYRHAAHFGVLKVMSKMGVSTLMSYKGAGMMQAVGVAQSVLDRCLGSGISVIGGVDFNVFSLDAFRLHRAAYPSRSLPRLIDAHATELDDTGEYNFRSIHEAEKHLNHPDTIGYVQEAARRGNMNAYRKFVEFQNALVDEVELRGQLDFCFEKCKPISISEVESAKNIVKRFCTGAMSYGSLSEEAHTTLAIAMNRIGGKSNTGEGGECEERYGPLPNGDSARSRVKQIASGRFGVTSAYIVNADELQVKVAQGAKPGEGGELPGFKVNGKIASTRKSTPGVGLISPPSHHDMYSIEDVAQLVSDLKCANPKARISCKLVSKIGIGVIAAGITKGKTDLLLISGGNGGTGAAKWTSIKHAGLPWELGLAETHQTLCLNKLREKVVLQADGQMKTGRDVVYAALLGAEEVCFSTQPLIVMGCIMMRKCHLNTCPVGITTQDLELRKKFKGQPEHVINYMFMVAEEIREYMSRLGFKRFQDMVGRSDLLKPKDVLKMHFKKKCLNFDKLLQPGWRLATRTATSMCCRSIQDHELERVLDKEIIRRASRSYKNMISTAFRLPIRNVDRTVGAMLSYEITKLLGSQGLPKSTINIKFYGSAGQSFAAFLCAGVYFELEGDANDYVGKGLSGGIVVVRPPPESIFIKETDKNIIIGNSALYGGTEGRAFFAGVAGERFAVRNSGVITVVEGVGDHGCEYMTRGLVVILGKTGKNFAAGMSGGIAYVYDIDKNLVNTQMVDLQSITKSEDKKTLESLIQEHYQRTNSYVAHNILANFETMSAKFTKVFPRDIKRVLREAIGEFVKTGSQNAAAILDDWESLTIQAQQQCNDWKVHALPFSVSVLNGRNAHRNMRLKNISNLVDQSKALGTLGKEACNDIFDIGLPSTEDATDEELFETTMLLLRTHYAMWRKGHSAGLKLIHEKQIQKVFPPQMSSRTFEIVKNYLIKEKWLLESHLRLIAEECDDNSNTKVAAWLKSLYSMKKVSSVNSMLQPVKEIEETAFQKESCRDALPEAQTVTLFNENNAYALKNTEVTFSDSGKMHKNESCGEFDLSMAGQIGLNEFLRKEVNITDVESCVYKGALDNISEYSVTAQTYKSNRPFLVPFPEKYRGFHLYEKQSRPYRNPNSRILDWEELTVPLNSRSRLYDQLLKTQAARCMDCGTPTCHYPNHGGGGCPLGNRIPTWNNLLHEGNWKSAIERLLDTNNFPEFTGRVCPAPCEDACVLSIMESSVAIKSIEVAIIDYAFQKGWIKPIKPLSRTGKKIAIVGSGPSGLAAAQQLNLAGHYVYVYEKQDRCGGLLMYGIPNMKIDKKTIVYRRIKLLEKEGIRFICNTEVGKDIMLDTLLEKYDAVLLCLGSLQPREINIKNRFSYKGIYQAIDFLVANQKTLLEYDTHNHGYHQHHHSEDTSDMEEAHVIENYVDAVDKKVIVIGGGDTAVDCVATAVRMGCASICQFSRKEELTKKRIVGNPWPELPHIFTVDYAHEEAHCLIGKDPREYSSRVVEFVPSKTDPTSIGGIKAVRVRIRKKEKNSKGTFDVECVDIAGSEKIYPADIVLLAMGFVGPDKIAFNNMKIPILFDEKNECIRANMGDFKTNINKLFACGDCRRGSSLVVWAISEGRDAARCIDEFVTNEPSILPRSFPESANPLNIINKNLMIEESFDNKNYKFDNDGSYLINNSNSNNYMDKELKDKYKYSNYAYYYNKINQTYNYYTNYKINDSITTKNNLNIQSFCQANILDKK